MRYGKALGIAAALTAISLAGCAPEPENVHPSPTAAMSPAPYTGPTQSPLSTPTPLPSPSWTLLQESLSWTGAASGTLTDAMATCDLPVDTIDLHTADYSADFSLPRHAPGIVAQSFPNQGASLHLQPGVGVHSYALFLAASGSVAYSPNGVSGSIDAWLAPQSNVPTSPSIHIIGRWRCA
jgi:hypothetical protein